ncbi:MAG: hypothetical protein FWH32_02795 [Clostridiales bacterium]|nr:hypothetical protein [Clostridiales bacterium]
MKPADNGRPARPGSSGRSRIGFVGLSAGAGATTMAFAAAEYLAALSKRTRTVTFLELNPGADAPAGRPYDKIGIDRRFAGRGFISHYRLAAEGKPLHGVNNMDGGIGWVLRVPGEPDSAPSAAALIRLLNNVPGDIIVCDISAQGFLRSGGQDAAGRDTLLALLADLDRIVCIFDPLPSRLLAAVPATEVCRAAETAGLPAIYAFNKLNAGVNLREATRFTGAKSYISIPAIPAETVYSAEYACRSLASEPEIKTALCTIFS